MPDSSRSQHAYICRTYGETAQSRQSENTSGGVTPCFLLLYRPILPNQTQWMKLSERGNRSEYRRVPVQTVLICNLNSGQPSLGL